MGRSDSAADADREEGDERDTTRHGELAKGRSLRLSGRGRIFFREMEGPPGAPVLLLLHGLVATSGLNWAQCFRSLAEHFRVIAPDQRGHGRGMRSWRRFRLEDCADDAAALLAALSIDSAIAVGYSMGGPVAELLWRRHPERVAGLVMCATSARPVGARGDHFATTPFMVAAAEATRMGQMSTGLTRALARGLTAALAREPAALGRRVAAAEMMRHDPRMIVEAALALNRYDAGSRVQQIDVPTAILLTTDDKTIPPEDQALLSRRIRGAKLFCVELGHGACADPLFAPELLRACLDVANRAAVARAPALRARARRGIVTMVDSLLGPVTS